MGGPAGRRAPPAEGAVVGGGGEGLPPQGLLRPEERELSFNVQERARWQAHAAVPNAAAITFSSISCLPNPPACRPAARGEHHHRRCGGRRGGGISPPLLLLTHPLVARSSSAARPPFFRRRLSRERRGRCPAPPPPPPAPPPACPLRAPPPAAAAASSAAGARASVGERSPGCPAAARGCPPA